MARPIEPIPEHEHSAECWPGAGDEFACPIMHAYRDMETAIRELLDWSLSRDTMNSAAWKSARKVHKDARRIYREG